MQNFVDYTVAEGFDGHFLFRGKLAEASACAIEFGLADGFEMILQRDDCGNDVQALQAGMEPSDLGFDNALGVLGFFFSADHMRADCSLQVVDVIDKDAVELVHLRIDVARDGNVDEEHGTVLATT